MCSGLWEVESVNITKNVFFFQKMMAIDWRIYLLSVIELIKLCNTDTSNQDRIEFSLNARPFTRNNNVQFIVLLNESKLFLKLNLIKLRQHTFNENIYYRMPKIFFTRTIFYSLFNIINSAIAGNTGTSCKINSLIKPFCHELLLLFCSPVQHRNPAGWGGLNISKTIRNISQHSPCLSDSDCEGEPIGNFISRNSI